MKWKIAKGSMQLLIDTIHLYHCEKSSLQIEYYICGDNIQRRHLMILYIQNLLAMDHEEMLLPIYKYVLTTTLIYIYQISKFPTLP